MAKKAQSTLINMFLSLTLIAVVAAAALALVSAVTAEPIAQVAQAKTDNAVKAVVPAHETLERVMIDGVECTKALAGDGSLVGVAIPTHSDKGFSGRIGVMVGFAADGTISGYQILQTAETPGLGAKAAQWFQKDGKGCVIGMRPGERLKVKKDGGDIDAISGSTITSRAFCEAVCTAYTKFEQIEKGE